MDGCMCRVLCIYFNIHTDTHKCKENKSENFFKKIACNKINGS